MQTEDMVNCDNRVTHVFLVSIMAEMAWLLSLC